MCSAEFETQMFNLKIKLNMNYETLTQEQLSALHIADVNESFLTFENEYATMEIFKSDTTTGFEIRGDEGFYLTIEQRKFMVEWLLS